MWPLRKAFEGYIPEEVLWRQKEQFSDGVGYNWINMLKATAEIEVTDAMMAGATERFPVKIPETKEAYSTARFSRNTSRRPQLSIVFPGSAASHAAQKLH